MRILLILLVLVHSPLKADDIIFVGLDANGEEIQVVASESAYQNHFFELANNFSQGLESLHERESLSELDFYKIEFGASLFMSFGIGDLLKFSVEPTFRFQFEQYK